MGNLEPVIALVFFLIFIRIMFQLYDTWYYTTTYEYAVMTLQINETLPINESLSINDNPYNPLSWWGYITGIRYSSANIPWWISALIYMPIFAGIIYLLIPTFK